MTTKELLNKKIALITLGCDKNRVDAENMLYFLKQFGFNFTDDPKDAEIVIVNTCAFLKASREESIDTILEIKSTFKKLEKLIVTGCLSEKNYEELKQDLTEADLILPLKENKFIVKHILNLYNVDVNFTPTFCNLNRVISTPKNYAYLKIGEGCSNMCTYCAIPYIRGKFISRKMEEIIEEAKMLASKGIKELIVIAQDTTKYGVDIYGTPKLPELLQKLSEIDGIKWIRFLYSYPEGITDELIEVVKNNEKICKYFDIPIQHISNKVLKRMNRKTNKEQIEKLIEKIRKEIPNIVLRTSLIVGFPGETDEDFEELKQFVEKTKFDKLGTFMYSKEEGTPAAKLPEQIHGNTKKARYNKIMQIQQKISNENLKNKIGQVVEVLIEDISFDGKFLIGRTSQDVPEEDGIIYVENTNFENKVNSFVNVKIKDVKDYDLIGEII